MRILRLDVGTGQRTSIDLHPFVTVVHGTSKSERAEVVDAVRALARGTTAGIRGLIQHQGLLFELDGDEVAPRSLSAYAGADVIIESGANATHDLHRLEERIAWQQRQAELKAVMVEEIRADLSLSVGADLAALEQQLSPAGRQTNEQRQVLAAELEAATAAVVGLEPTHLQAAEGVLELRDRWLAHHGRRVQAAGHRQQLTSAVEQAKARFELAEETLAEAEAASKPVLLTREEEARLELLSFPDAVPQRRGRRRKGPQPEQEAEKAELLAKVGVESWTAYTMYRASPSVSIEAVEALAAARLEFGDARARLAAAEGDRQHDGLLHELDEEVQTLRLAAQDHLDSPLPEDVAAALGELIVEGDSEDWTAAVAHLAHVLGRLQDWERGERRRRPAAEPDSKVDPVELLAAAQTWLDGYRASGPVDVASLERRLDRYRLELARHERALGRIEQAEATAAQAAIVLAQLQEQQALQSTGCAGAVESVLAAVEPIAGQVALDGSGPVPIAIVGELEGVSDDDVVGLLDQLVLMASGIQVLIVSNRKAALKWARRTSLDRAMVSEARSAQSVRAS